MDLKRIFSGRVIGLIAFIVVVLFLGAVGNMSLEGFGDDLAGITDNVSPLTATTGGNTSSTQAFTENNEHYKNTPTQNGFTGNTSTQSGGISGMFGLSK